MVAGYAYKINKELKHGSSKRLWRCFISNNTDFPVLTPKRRGIGGTGVGRFDKQRAI
jgi:hypothetical protein